MKKLYSIVLTLVLCITLLASTAAAAKSEGTYSAIATNNAIVVSNSTDAPDAHLVHPAVYKIEGANYFKLRDLAMLLNGSEKQFAVDYDDNAKAVSITSGKPYTAVGGELSGTAAASRSAIISNNTISINGNSTDLTVFKIDGANYFKLRDLGKALNFHVGYDDETKTVFISGAKGYETTENNGTSQETIVLKEPPALTVVCGENNSIEALKGTYSWTYPETDGTMVSICADSIHPLSAKKIMPFFANPDSSRAELLWTTAPDEISVRCWSEECWGQFDAKSEAIPVEVFETETLDGSYSRGFMMELKGGNYIYEVIAKWNSYEKYNGTACYSFYTVMNDTDTNVQLVNIVDLTEVNQLSTDSALEEFFKDRDYTYYFPSIKSEYIECQFSNGDTMKFVEALESKKVTISDLDTYDIMYWIVDKEGNYTNSLER